MERIKFVVREVNKLLGTTYNLLSFDALKCAELLLVVCDVFHAIEAGPKVKPNQDVSQIALTILSSLQSIKYEPSESVNPMEFCNNLAAGNKGIIYPLMEWILTNQNKVRKRAYLAKYANKIPIPPESLADSDVKAAYKIYERIIEGFWNAYREYTIAKKESFEATELKRDIKKMEQDIKNVTNRTQAQWEKISNIKKRDSFIHFGKTYRSMCKEHRNLTKQIKEGVQLINKLESRIKSVEELLQRRERQTLLNANIVEMIEEEARVNKIAFEIQLPLELENLENTVINMENTLDRSCPSRNSLQLSVDTIKDKVHQLTAEKLNLFTNTEDKLGAFRKQAGTIALKKLELSQEVNDIKNELSQIEENIQEKELTLFNTVGGEILRGEELRRFVAKLREKSNFYKKLRAQLEGLSTELGIENRTMDVLRSIDPSIDGAYVEASVTPKKECKSKFSNSIVGAKQFCKQFMQEVEILKTSVSKADQETRAFKKQSDTLNQTLEHIKEHYEKATKSIVSEIQQWKVKIRITQNDIESLEQAWKTNALSLDKSEYIFNCLLDEMIIDSDEESSGSDSYLGKLLSKKDENQKLVDEARNSMEKLEERKKLEEETIEFFKHTAYIIHKKLE